MLLYDTFEPVIYYFPLSSREMLERALVKRLRDSDSDSGQEEESSSTKRTNTDRPTDILTTDKPIDTQVRSLMLHISLPLYLDDVCMTNKDFDNVCVSQIY